jgi:hypothetical protein
LSKPDKAHIRQFLLLLLVGSRTSNQICNTSEHAASSILNNHGAPRAAMAAYFLLVDSNETIDEQQLTLFYTIAKDRADLAR